ncbi:hypothetical protein [Bizionia echini]|uniref:hypothetical protein n=1 Tax=Bizionia echini TaxID=649333 RepID=UPI0030D96B40
MARDIRDLLKEDDLEIMPKMPSGHEDRFLQKLNTALPKKKTRNVFWMQIAASIVIVFALGFGTYAYFNQPVKTTTVVDVAPEETPFKTLGDISPDFKKVEDYYLANINLELSKVTLTSDNKELIDGYILRLDALNAEYKRLSMELTEQGPNELTVSALITNLKFRLNLMYRLKEQLQSLRNSDTLQKKNNA